MTLTMLQNALSDLQTPKAPSTDAYTAAGDIATPAAAPSTASPQLREKAVHLFDQLCEPTRSREEKGKVLLLAITNGIDNINAQDLRKGTGMEKWSLLHHAIHMGDTPTLNALLGAEHIQVHTRDKAGSSPLHHAATLGDVAAVKALLDKYRRMHADDPAALRSFVNSTNGAARTPMHLAATSPHPAATMQLLFDAGAAVDPTTRSGMSTPLSYAVKAYGENPQSSLEAVTWLIGNGADPNASILINKTNRSVAAAEALADIQGNKTSPLEIARGSQWSALADIMCPRTSPDETSTPWLTPDGTLDVSVPIAELFRMVVTVPSGLDHVDELARLFCNDVYENAGYFYESSDAYYTCEDIGRAGYENDLDHDDLMSVSREHVANNISEWMDETSPSVAEQIRALMTAGISNTADAATEIEGYVSNEFRSYTLKIMEKTAMEWYD